MHSLKNAFGKYVYYDFEYIFSFLFLLLFRNSLSEAVILEKKGHKY
jgi:hypothetical protein